MGGVTNLLRGGILSVYPRPMQRVGKPVNLKQQGPRPGKNPQRGIILMDQSIIVALKDIVIDFDDETVLNGLSLDIHDKEFVTLLGP